MPAGTISTQIPVFFDNQFRRWFDRMTIWRQLCEDYSPVFAMGGKTYKIPVDFTNYGPANDQLSGGTGSDDVRTVTAGGTSALQTDATDEDTTSLDKTDAASLAWQDPTLMQLGEVELTIDHGHDARVLVSYWQEQRTLPRLVAQEAERVGTEMRIAVSRYIRDTIFNGAGNYELLPKITVADASDDWENAAHKTAIYNALKDACLLADEWQWPREGRTLIVGPAVYQIIVQDMIDKNIHFARDVNDRAYIDGMTPGVWGWNIMMDTDIATSHAAPADASNHTLYFMSARRGVGYAQDIMRMRTYEAETYKGWITQGIQNWGAAVLNPRYQFQVKHAITAA